MKSEPISSPLLDYRGARWIHAHLPGDVEPWPLPTKQRSGDALDRGYDIGSRDLHRYTRSRPWVWPDRTVYFFCDQHADADAFFASLVASGGVEKTGPGDADFELTPAGRAATFVIGGDCFDKGPANLRLLRAIRSLLDAGADVEILAGNHDLRTLVGLSYVGRREPRFAHLFVRMGQKTIPLFKEIWDQYLAGGPAAGGLGESDEELRATLFPDASWYEEFPKVADGLIPPKKLEKEVRRIREKVAEFDERCQRLGMSLAQVYAAAMKAQELLMAPDGEFRWFFDRMNLARRFGSFLFVHAGLDDVAARVLRERGVGGLNAWFHETFEADLFELYHGSVGNCFRTKYREIDYPLTAEGVADVHRAGVYAIVHGHRNILRGQRLVIRHGILNFECDCSVDINTRHIEDLRGRGAAVTIFRPDGRILGISTDHPRVKLFDPAHGDGFVTIV